MIQNLYSFILGFLLAVFAVIISSKPIQKIDLPEKYEAITDRDTLKGYFDSNGILHIEFNNSKNCQKHAKI